MQGPFGALVDWVAQTTIHMSTPTTPTQVLLRPNIMRLLLQLPFWAVAFSAFFKSMELASPSNITPQLSFAMYFMGNVTGSASGLLMMGLIWFPVARHYWLHDKAARIRYEQEGMYALMPRPVFFLVMTLLYVTSAAFSNRLWCAYMDLSDSWTPNLRVVSTLKTSMIFHGFALAAVFTVDFFRVREMMQRRRAESAHRLNVEAQLQRLQAQMEPHMLFNTLANLHALIETQPAKAQDMLAHLIDYLRATLSASRAGTLTLGEEIARVDDYLSLMQIRMGQRLRIYIDVPTSLHDADVPPMLVQPLVENAIKHGLDPVPEGGTLRVTARRVGQTLEIVVHDNGRGLPAEGPTMPSTGEGGFGLQCIRARLQTAFGEHACLTLSSTPAQAGTIATLRMPFHATSTSPAHS